MIKGGTLRKTVIYTDRVAPSNGVKTTHEIRMTEVQLDSQPEKPEKPIHQRFCARRSTSGNTLTPCWRSR